MVSRFDRVFGNKRGIAGSNQISSIVQHLRRHTRRRRGDNVVDEGFIEWEQTSRVYDLFSVELSIFERIFFTVDVSESTSVLSKLCSTGLVLMIMLSIVMWMLSTHPSMQEVPPDCIDRMVARGRTGTDVGECSPEPTQVFATLEVISVAVFTA